MYSGQCTELCCKGCRPLVFPLRIPGLATHITTSPESSSQILSQSHLIPPSQIHPRPIPDQKYVYRMSHSLDEQSSTNYKEAFSLFDKRGTGRVSLESLGDLLRACGQNPTLAEISDLEKNLGGDFDFDAFSRVLSRPGGFRDPGEPEEYCRGFQVFDKDMTGVIGVGQLRYSMFFFFFSLVVVVVPG